MPFVSYHSTEKMLSLLYRQQVIGGKEKLDEVSSNAMGVKRKLGRFFTENKIK